MLKNLVAGAILVCAYVFWMNMEITHGPGEVAPDTPEIMRLTWQKPFNYKNYNFKPMRSIEGEVRVLEMKRYFFDEEKELAPYDIFAGWSKMSDERYLENMLITLSDRDAHLQFSNPKMKVAEVYKQTDLLHFVPANTDVKDAMNKLRKGHVIKFKGVLANVKKDPSFHWKTSVNLNDIGNTADKIVWIEELVIL